MYSSRWEWAGGDSSPQRLSRHWTRGDGKTLGLRIWGVEDVSGIALSPKMILLIQVHLCLTASLGNLSSSGTTIGLVSLTTKHKVLSKTIIPSVQVGCRGGLGVGNPPDHLVTSPLALPWDSLWDSQAPSEKKGISLPWDHPGLQPSWQGCEQGNLKVDASLVVSVPAIILH